MDKYQTLVRLIEREHRYLELEQMGNTSTKHSPKWEEEMNQVRDSILLLRKRFNKLTEDV